MAFTNSPNMLLPIPGVGSEAGPTFAFDINNSLTIVDSHDHSLGRGVQVTPAGLNIDADLTFDNNSLTDSKSIVFTAQSSVTTLQALYVKPGPESPLTEDLWYNDGNGVQVQLTSGGAVNATIANLPGESYSAGTFYWKQGDGSTTPANFDIGSITIRPNTAGTANGVVLNPPSGISSEYDIQLPELPLVKGFLTLDSAGNMDASTDFSAGITGSMIAAKTITFANIADSVVAPHTQTFTASTTWTVPAGVTLVTVTGVGGGGGGAGGKTTTDAVSSGGGGAGGGSLPSAGLPLVVTPGAVLTVTIGAGGAAVGVGANGNPGVNSAFDSLTFFGGTAGTSPVTGAGKITGGAGGAAVPAFAYTAGGAGGDGGTAGLNGSAGVTGQRSYYAVAGTGGAGGATGGGFGGGGGGGGGGASFGAGANGGAGGGATGATGSSAAANSGAGGGGGGGGRGGGGVGGGGGAGGSGKIIISWLGNT